MKEIKTEIILEAPAARIWELLADIALYQYWNPLFQRASGQMTVGEQLELVVHLPQIEPFSVKPTLKRVVPQSAFCWQYVLQSKRVFCGSFCTKIETLPDQQLKVVLKSSFGGLMGPLFSLSMSTPIAAGLESLNKALRRWGEKGNIQCLRC